MLGARRMHQPSWRGFGRSGTAGFSSLIVPAWVSTAQLKSAAIELPRLRLSRCRPLEGGKGRLCVSGNVGFAISSAFHCTNTLVSPDIGLYREAGSRWAPLSDSSQTNSYGIVRRDPSSCGVSCFRQPGRLYSRPDEPFQILTTMARHCTAPEQPQCFRSDCPNGKLRSDPARCAGRVAPARR
jgi:hypothetical protein